MKIDVDCGFCGYELWDNGTSTYCPNPMCPREERNANEVVGLTFMDKMIREAIDLLLSKGYRVITPDGVVHDGVVSYALEKK